MRKVAYKKHIPAEYRDGKKVAGSGQLEAEYSQEGIFHQWGASFVEFESGPANFTVGLIELPNGSMVEIEPGRIKFLQPQTTTAA